MWIAKAFLIQYQVSGSLASSRSSETLKVITLLSIVIQGTCWTSIHEPICLLYCLILYLYYTVNRAIRCFCLELKASNNLSNFLFTFCSIAFQFLIRFMSTNKGMEPFLNTKKIIRVLGLVSRFFFPLFLSAVTTNCQATLCCNDDSACIVHWIRLSLYKSSDQLEIRFLHSNRNLPFQKTTSPTKLL